MSTRSRESIYGSSVRASAERAHEAPRAADQLACEAWNQRMLGFKGPAQPSPSLGDALNAGYLYLEVRCLGCDTHQTVALNTVRRPKAILIHELERYMRCKDCSQVRGYPYKRSHALRRLKSRPSTRLQLGGRESVDASDSRSGSGHCGAYGSNLLVQIVSIVFFEASSSMNLMALFCMFTLSTSIERRRSKKRLPSIYRPSQVAFLSATFPL
jgi:hypothetical protein